MMQKLIYFIFVFIISVVSFQTFAQVDGSNGGNLNGSSIGIIKAPATEINKPKSLDFNNDKGFKNANKELKKEQQKKQSEEDLKNKGIITPEMIARQHFNKNAERFSYEIPMIDMDLGSFHTKSKNINISSYDFGKFDGDVITIYKNGTMIVKNYVLKNDIKLFTIPLDIGFNKIEILAVDEGKLRPNTGAFTIYDDNKEIVASDMWYLAKGAKVIAQIVRIDK
ncbi:hypothetical protein [Tenacibaculum adriaticum]|nr:hypothetical protein [Tenacibaculum adriaticum]